MSRRRARGAVLGGLCALVLACGPDAEERAAASDARFARGEAAYEEGAYARAAERYLEAATLAREAGDPARERAARAQAAVALKMDGRTGRARSIMLEVLDEARAAGDARTEGLALGNLARLNVLDGRPADALARLDELAAFAAGHDEVELEVKTLEQAIALSLELGELDGAARRLDRALARDAALDEEDSRAESLLGQRATMLARRGDDEGAQALWIARGASAAALANRARHAGRLGLHEKAAALAREAAHLFERDGRPAERDRAILVRLDQLVAAGALGDAATLLEEHLALAAGDGEARAPLLVLRARVRMLEGRPGAARSDLLAARDLVGEGEDRVRVERLLAAAAILDGDLADAGAWIEGLAPDRARGLLEAWRARERPPEDSLASEAAAGLRIERFDPDDASEAELRALVGARLPRASWLALEVHLADAERLRARGRDALARDYVRWGVVEALQWQAIEAHERLPVAGMVPDLEGIGATLERWTDGGLADDVAVAALVPGVEVSYRVVVTDEGATTFGAPPRDVLVGAARAATDALRRGEDVVERAAALYETVLGPAAEPLAARRRWVLVLPDALLGAPPPMWVSDEASARWVVLDHDVALLPCAPPRPGGAPALEPWTLIDAPALELSRFSVASEVHRTRFGDAAFGVQAVELPLATSRHTGAAATAAALRGVPASGVLHLAVPGFGGGRLGGLALAPDEDAAFHDERAGWLPWHRVATLRLPPTVLLEGTRFDPVDPLEREGGAGTAALCVLQSAERALLRRWPVPPPAQAEILGRAIAALREGASLAGAVADAQRGALETAPRVPPRLWAPWLVFERP